MRKRRRPTSLAPAIAFGALAAVYAATAAPRVTFWDAGEFVTAFHTLGIPHPPGTPLLVLLGRAWEVALGWAGAAHAAALLAAACTAAAGAITAWLVARWSGSVLAGVSAAVCAGATSTVWANATEAEAYAPALCLSLAAVGCGERAGQRDDARWTLAAAYLLALAVPLHLSALVAAPAVALLAATRGDGRLEPGRLLVVGGAGVLAAGAGRASIATAASGAAVLAAAALVPRRAAGGRVAWGTVARVAAVVALGVSPVVVLLLRARHDPALNQGDPSTWGALADVLARRQYAVAPPWPRQAPWWLQLGNLAEWADWQFAYGLAPGPAPSWRRTPITVAYALLGVVGAAWHRRRDRRSWRATLALLLAGSVGVAAYLNLRAGPSFGWGVLPDGAPREARERDYFFVLAWWVWGAWAALGALAVAARAARVMRRASPSQRPRARHARWTAAAVAALPLALNWRTADRRAEPDALLADGLARALLAATPPRGVLLVNGDNDTYPVWHAQLVDGVRPDVTPVTVPLLGAAWYRRELARRHGLLPSELAEAWVGDTATAAAIAAAAGRAGRPIAVAAAAPAGLREAIGGRWVLAGPVFVRDPARPAVALPGLDYALDTAAARGLAPAVAPALRAPAREGGDWVGRWAQGLLRCPALALRATRDPRDTAAADSLDATCNRK